MSKLKKSNFLVLCGLLVMLGANETKANYLKEKHMLNDTKKYDTDSVLVKGDYFTYRKIGTDLKSKIPIILFNHTRGNLDSWDPAFINALALERIVIIFNNKGIASSKGEAPDNFRQMAEDANEFIKALGYKKVDLLGFSIGGCVVQELLLSPNKIVRNAILAGTAAKGARSINERNPKIVEIVTAPTLDRSSFLQLFFDSSASSQTLGKEFWKRKVANKFPVDNDVSMAAAKAQAIARANWGKDHLDSASYNHIGIPILIANGKNDIMMPTENSLTLFSLLPNAQLNLYPDSGHGFLFQYPLAVAADFNRFLNANNN